MEEQGIKMNRLAVLLQIIFIPIYFTAYSILWKDKIIENLTIFLESSYNILFFTISLQWLKLGETFVFWATVIGLPVFYSLPWVIFSILKAQRIADAYELMGKALGRVRLDQKIFYGLNALFALVFFILPFFSPIITVVGIFVSVRMLTYKVKIGKIHSLVWILPSLALAFIPMLFVGSFYLEYTHLFADVITLWNTWLDILFGIGVCMAIAISFGNFKIFLSEVQIDLGKAKEIDYASALLIKVLVFGVALVFYFWLDPNGVVIYFLNWIALVLGVTALLLRQIKMRGSSQHSDKGFLLIPIFAGVQIISERVAKSVAIGLAAAVFIVLFFISYKVAGDEEFILENQ